MREIEEPAFFKEKISKPPRLLYIPGLHAEEVMRKGALKEEGVVPLMIYWYRAKKFVEPAVNFPGVVRLYLEGLYSSSKARLSSGEPKFQTFAEEAREASKLEPLGGQWSVSLPLLLKKQLYRSRICGRWRGL